MRQAWCLCLALLASVFAASLAAQSSVKVTGYMQPRFQAIGDSATFLLRRARFAVEGQAAAPVASPLTLSATDIWVRLANKRWGATFGQFRVPFSLESVTSSGVLETTERSRIVLAAKRDIGVQGQWSVPDRVVVQGAVVNGDGPNRGGNRDNRMAYFARAVVTPVKGLDVGGAFEGYADSTGVDAQTIYRTRRWTARAEYIRVRQRATDVRTTGWYALGTYLLRPQHLQLVARVQQFDPSNQVAVDRLTGYLVGGQYFFRGDDLKLVADYEVFREQVTQLKNDRLVVQMQ